MFAFYDMNAGKNIINASNVRVLWYERGEKYHKCLDFPDFMIQECLQNIINHVGFAICDTSTEYLKTPKNQPFKISISNQTRPGRKMTVSALSKPSGHHPIKAPPHQSPHITPSSLPIPPHFCLTFADKLPAFNLRIDKKPCPVRVNLQLFIKSWLRLRN